MTGAFDAVSSCDEHSTASWFLWGERMFRNGDAPLQVNGGAGCRKWLVQR